MKDKPQVVVWPRQRLWMTYVLLGLCGLFFGAWLLTPPAWQATLRQWLTQPTWPAGLGWVAVAGLTHIYWLTLALNGYSLYAVGQEVERFFGAARLAVIFCLTSWAGFVLQLGITQQGAVGAASSVFGLLGAFGIFIYRHRWLFSDQGRGIFQRLVMVVALNLILLAWVGGPTWSLLGGLVVGCFLGWLIGPLWKLTPYVPATVAAQTPKAQYWEAHDVHPLDRARWLEVLACALGLLVLANAVLG